MNCLVVILDGYSFIFANTFLWWRENIKKLLHFPGTKRDMCYINTIAYTPHALKAAFTFSFFKKTPQGPVVTNYVWDCVNVQVKVINLPIDLPPLYRGVQTPKEWLDYFTPKKEEFEYWVKKYHNFVLKHGNAENLIVWYPVPDQAHHHFFICHLPETLALTNFLEPPKKITEVAFWLFKALKS